MNTLYIPHLLKARDRTQRVEFDEFLPDLETLTPARGWVKLSHQGNYLDVSAKIETIITLSCNRCLANYNHRLVIKPTELIWLSDGAVADLDGLMEQDLTVTSDLIETLPSQGHFVVGEWVYQQLCLAIPQKQLCRPDCAGINPAPAPQPEQKVDQRWASLQSLRDRLPQ